MPTHPARVTATTIPSSLIITCSHEAPGQSLATIHLPHVAGSDAHALEFYNLAVYKLSALSICLLF